MKKLYMRAGMSPTDIFSPEYILWNNSIGNNVGNLLYAYGVNRTLSVEGTEVVPTYYKLSSKTPEEVNEEYDAFIIPLADAFRPDFRAELRNMTALIKKLTIPCVVIGVGLRAEFEPDLEQSFEFDEDVTEFMKAVLEKSSMVGVRGEITAQYLSKLGFREGIDHTVIGCPSMYTYGKNVKIRDTKLTEDSMISINSSVLSPEHVHKFLYNTMQKIPNHYFLPQRIQELRTVYTGQPYAQNYSEYYPSKMSDKIYEENRVRFMLNVPTWLDFLRQADLSVGGRLHGNIASIVAGTPALLIPHDARMRELTNYHNLPHIWAKDMDENADIFELFAKMDFKQVEKVHEKNFEHYIDFLDKNGLDHIYKDGMHPEEAPLDRRVAKADLLPPLETISGCTKEELFERWQKYYPEADAKMERIKGEVRRLRVRTKSLETECKDTRAEFKNLEKQRVDAEKKAQKIEAKNESLTEKNKNLTEKNKNLIEKNTSLKEKNASLTEKNTSLKEKNANLKEKNEKLKKECEELKEQERKRKEIEDAKLVNRVKRKVKKTLKM